MSLRTWLASPAYVLLAVATVAIRFAAVGLIFAVVETVLLRPLPFAASDRLVAVSQKVPFVCSSPSFGEQAVLVAIAALLATVFMRRSVQVIRCWWVRACCLI